jgi:PAS domain S-box-containing protein
MTGGHGSALAAHWPDPATRAALGVLSDALIATDAHGKVVYANSSAERLLGWGRGELEGKPVSVVLSPNLQDYLPAGTKAVRTAMKPLTGRPVRISSRRKDGSEISTELVLSLVECVDGPIVVAAIRLRMASHLSRWSELTATLFDALSHLEPQISPDAQLLKLLGTQLGCDMTSLWALTSNGQLRFREVWSDPESDPQGQFRSARAESVVDEVNLPQYVLSSGEPLRVPNLRQDERFSVGPAARAGLVTAIVFPVRYGGAVVGVVELFWAEPRQGDPDLLDLVRAVSRPVGEMLGALEHSVERERMLNELTIARARQEFVLRVTRLVAAARDYPSTVRQLAEVAVPVLGDLCLIDVVDEDGTFTRMAAHHHDSAVSHLVKELQTDFAPEPGGRHPTIEVLASGSSRWSGDMTEDFLRATTRNDRHYEIVKALGFESFMALPLVAGDTILGTLTLVSAGSGRHFDADDLAWAEQLASQVSSVLDRARRHQLEADVSHRLQRSLLPEILPVLENIELGARYLPATKHSDVGGDWYDVVEQDDKLALVVGDVAGHDIRAATVMGKLRHGLALLLSEGLPPGEALTRLNRFARSSTVDRLATVLVVIVDYDSDQVAMCSAGHYPPVLRTEDSCRLVRLRPCPPIGVRWTEKCEEFSIPLTVGDLVLFTDGLVDQRTTDLEARLGELEVSVSLGPREPEALCDHVLSALLIPGDDRSDDVAILAASVRGGRTAKQLS